MEAPTPQPPQGRGHPRRSAVTVTNMAAVAANTEPEQSGGGDDSTSDMSGISDDDDSAYLDEGEQDVADDGSYVNDEDPTHPSFAWWTPGEVPTTEP